MGGIVTRALKGGWLRDTRTSLLMSRHSPVREDGRKTHRRAHFFDWMAILVVLLGAFSPSGFAGVANAITASGGGTFAPASINPTPQGVAPSITTPPVSADVTVGQTATFSVTATGTAPLSYQWKKNGTAVSGATSSSYTTPATVSSDSAGNVTSSAGTLNVHTAPYIPSSEPANQTVNVGQTATFSVSAMGVAPLSYQWKKNGTSVSGATSSSYTTPATVSSDNGAQFTVVVTNSAGNATSNAATLTVNAPPTITTPPVSADVTVGQTATFSVTATGTAPLSYQWKKNGTAVSGATSSSYTTPATVSSDNGAQFTVVVTNSAGNVTSSAGTLNVHTAPYIPSSEPASQTVNVGQTATFSVSAMGMAPLSYQWKKNGTAVSGATSSSYTTPATVSSDNGAQFTVVVTNSAGNATSNAATLTVNSTAVAPSITTQPANQTVNVGQTASFSVAATGTAPLSYQWNKNGTAVSGATSSSYTTPATASSDNGAQFTVVVTNSAGNATSSVATLTVIPTSGTTTAYGLTFPNAHPRLFWTPSRIAIAETWVAGSGYPGLTTSPRPLDDYDVAFTCFVGPASAQASACAQAVDDAVSFTPSNPNGVGDGDDNMRALGEQRILIRDWLYPGCGKASCLSSGQVTTFDSNWSTWQANQDSVTQTWGNVGMPASNYFCGQFRNDFDFGIASYIDNPNADANLQYGAVSRWNDVLNFVSPTGTGKNGTFGYALYNQEGGGEYGRYCLNYYAFSLASSPLLDRDMWTETTAFQSGVLQTIYNTVLTQTTSRGLWDGFTWGDDEDWVNADLCGYISHNATGNTNTSGGCGMESQYYGDFMQAAATEYAGTNIGEYARQWLATVKPAIGPIFRSVDPGGSALAFSTLPLDYYASGTQYMYVHDNWTSNGTAMLLQMGLNHGGNPDPSSGLLTGHSHLDAGTFQVSRKGVNIIRETMGYSDTVAGYNNVGTAETLTGFAHNIPLIGGEASMNVFDCSDGPGIVRRLETQSGYAFAVTDLTLTYQNNVCDSGNPGRENPHAVSVVREYYYFRGINVLVILDRLESDASTTSTTFVSHCETNPRVVSATIACVDGTQEAFYTALVPAAPTIAIVAENANGANAANWQYRMEANNSNPGNVVSYNIYTIQLGDASDFSALAPGIVDSIPGSPSSGTFTITLDPNNSLIVNKGVTSSGGTIKAAGTTNSLATTVETMTITSSGPVW
jgi:hypothetical protein